MNKSKFETLCEQTLIPQIDELVRRRVKLVQKTLEILARAIAHIERKIDQFEPPEGWRK